MNEQNVLSMFLRIVTEYDYLDYSEEELMEDFTETLSMALLEVQMQGIMEDCIYDVDEGFVEPLSMQQAYILAYASVLIWVTPKVNSAEMLAAQLTSTDFTQFSNANRLNACLKLYTACEAKLNNLISDFDKAFLIAEIKEELSDK